MADMCLCVWYKIYAWHENKAYACTWIELIHNSLRRSCWDCILMFWVADEIMKWLFFREIEL